MYWDGHKTSNMLHLSPNMGRVHFSALVDRILNGRLSFITPEFVGKFPSFVVSTDVHTYVHKLTVYIRMYIRTYINTRNHD